MKLSNKLTWKPEGYDKKWGNQLVQCLSLKVQPSTLVTLLHQAGLGRSKSLIPQGRLPLPLPSLPSTLLSNLYLLIDILYSIISYSITYFPLKVHSCFVLIHGSSREKYTFVVLQLCLHPLHRVGVKKRIEQNAIYGVKLP